MHPYRRALSAVIATTVVGAGLSTGLAAGAAAAPAEVRAADSADLVATLAGLGQAGSPLTLVLPPELTLATATVEWLRDGVVLPGITGGTYTPTAADVGSQIRARVTPLLSGLPLPPILTNAVSVVAAPGGGTDGEELTVSTLPSLTGTPAKVGRTLSVTDPTWKDAEGVSHTYQWLRGDTAITGATRKSYVLTPDDLDRAVSVAVTGTKEGWTAGTARSNAVIVAKGDAPRFTVAPSVTGRAVPGQVLTVDPGAWGEGATPTYTYQWRRNGAAVGGATGPTFDVGLQDVAQALSVTVTATRPAFEPGTVTTSSMTVARAVSATKATLAKKKLPRGKAAVLRVATKAMGRFVPGRLAVYDGTKKLRTVSVKAAAAKIRLKGLRPGVHKLRVVHLGNRYVAPSRSQVLRLVVKR